MSRNQSKPITEVVVTRSDAGKECLYVGEITGTSMLRMWEDEEGQEHNERYHVIARVDTPEPMTAQEAADWADSGPDELNEELEHDLPDDIGSGVGMTEFYPEW